MHVSNRQCPYRKMSFLETSTVFSSKVFDHVLRDLTMADLYERLLDSIDTLTPEQLAELASIINAKQPKTEKSKKEIHSNEKQPYVQCGSINT